VNDFNKWFVTFLHLGVILLTSSNVFHNHHKYFMDHSQKSREELELENQELRARLERLEYAVESAGDGIWDLRYGGSPSYYSSGCKRMLGYEDDSMLNTLDEWFALIHPEDAESNRRDIESYSAGTTSSYSSQFRLRCADGTYKWILSRGRSIEKDSNGGPRRVIGIHTDISLYKHLEEMLLERERIFHLVTDNMTDMVTLFDLQGRVLFITPSVELIGGYRPEEVTGQDALIFIHPDDIDSILLPAYHRAINQGIDSLITYRVRQKSGQFRWVESSIRPINDGNGNVVLFQSATRDITARKQAEELFQSAFQATPVMMIIASAADNRMVDANQASLSTLGYTKDELLKLTTRMLVYHEVAASDSIQEALLVTSCLPIINYEISLRAKSGEEIEGLLSANLIHLDGKPHFLYSIMPISERKRIERALQKNEQRLREAQHVARLGSWELDLITWDLEWSDEVYEIFSVDKSQHEDLKEWFDQRVHPEDFDPILPLIHKAIDTRTPYYHIHRILLQDGQIRYIQEHAIASYGNRGEPVRMFGTAQDITELVEAQKKLEESQRDLQIFKTVLESASEAIAISEISGRLIYINPAHEKLFGRSLEEARKANFRDYYPPESVEILNTVAVPTLMNSGTWVGIIDVYGADGKLFPLWEHSGVIRDPDGSNKLFFGFMHDDTQRIRAEEELRIAKDQAEAANRAKSEFLAMVSHEIRTPMNAILGFTRLLDSNLTDPRLKGYLLPIQSSGETLISLINDILDLSKIEAGRLTVQLRPVLLKQVFSEIAHMFSLRASEKGLDLITTIDPALPGELEIDEVRLRQVLFNLVGNAIKYTDQGHVILAAHVQKNRKRTVDLTIVVEDSGTGIAPEDLENIFEAFAPHKTHENRKLGSTGLGLAISKRLVDLMGGTISVNSEVGQWTIFKVVLPEVKISPSSHGSVDKSPIDDGSRGQTTQFLTPPGPLPATLSTPHPKPFPPWLVEELDTRFLPRWQEFRELQPVDGMRHFAEDLAELGDQAGYQSLTAYASRLLAAIDLFDIEEIDRLLGSFPELLITG
jgi:two-component system, sensor histidine kinase and response regulator